eukprot:647005-Rhodomonas_salina.2
MSVSLFPKALIPPPLPAAWPMNPSCLLPPLGTSPLPPFPSPESEHLSLASPHPTPDANPHTSILAPPFFITS